MSEPASTQSTATSGSGSELPVSVAQRLLLITLRTALFLLGPVVIGIVTGYLYINSGRYAETDNAYVKARTVIVSAEASGRLTAVHAHENERVSRDTLLFEVDSEPYEVSVDQAEAQLETVTAYIEGIRASYRQRLEEMNLARTNVAFREREFAREQSLAERGLGSDIDLDRARHELDVARQQLPIIEQALAQLRAQLGEAAVTPGDLTAIQRHAAWRTVNAMLENARLHLDQTHGIAPIDGVVSNVPEPGRYVAAGSPVLSMVSDKDVWIEANFKETDLGRVQIGQPVAITVDAYPDQSWRGSVDSISPATGAEFSVIPAQNASGNWVKVAQRIPVRIAVETPAALPQLRAGMSTIVSIDTGYLRPAPPYLGFLNALREQ